MVEQKNKLANKPLGSIFRFDCLGVQDYYSTIMDMLVAKKLYSGRPLMLHSFFHHMGEYR